jgi:hypothetical protein
LIIRETIRATAKVIDTLDEIVCHYLLTERRAIETLPSKWGLSHENVGPAYTVFSTKRTPDNTGRSRSALRKDRQTSRLQSDRLCGTHTILDASHVQALFSHAASIAVSTVPILLIFWLMQPTVRANPGLSAYRAPRDARLELLPRKVETLKYTKPSS